ncbi:MAG: 4-azaleucine resistance transporter AzlC [Motiliproteus sp.]|jgi:4-azaleucine resistance transporter AzlC
MNTVEKFSASNEAESPDPFSKLVAVVCVIAPVSMLFGMIAYKADWSITQIFLVSLLGFSGSGQFAALPLSESGSGLFTIVMVTTLINSRYFFIALSCSKKLPRNKFLRVITAHTLCDEAYAIEQNYNQKEMLIIRFSIFICWIIFGVLGGVIAERFPDVLPENINISFPASLVLLFLAISQLQVRSFNSGLVTMPKAVLGLLISAGFYYVLGAVYFWIPSIVVLSVFYYALRNKYGE